MCDHCEKIINYKFQISALFGSGDLIKYCPFCGESLEMASTISLMRSVYLEAAKERNKREEESKLTKNKPFPEFDWENVDISCEMAWLNSLKEKK